MKHVHSTPADRLTLAHTLAVQIENTTVLVLVPTQWQASSVNRVRLRRCTDHEDRREGAACRTAVADRSESPSSHAQ